MRFIFTRRGPAPRPVEPIQRPWKRHHEPFAGQDLSSAELLLQQQHPGATVIASEQRMPPTRQQIEAFQRAVASSSQQTFPTKLPWVDEIHIRFPLPDYRADGRL